MGNPENEISFHPSRLREFVVCYTKFSVVGLSNGAVDYGTLNLLLFFLPTGDPAWLVLYNAVALVLTNTNSYLWNTLWTFKGRAEHSRRQVIGFTAQALLNIGVASGVVWLAARLLFAHTAFPPLMVDNLAKLVSSVVATSLSFLILRHLVFGHARGGPGERTGDERPTLSRLVPQFETTGPAQYSVSLPVGERLLAICCPPVKVAGLLLKLIAGNRAEVRLTGASSGNIAGQCERRRIRWISLTI